MECKVDTGQGLLCLVYVIGETEPGKHQGFPCLRVPCRQTAVCGQIPVMERWDRLLIYYQVRSGLTQH